MIVCGKHYRTIWLKADDPTVVQIIDQRHLPHRFVIEELTTVEDMARAIADMHVRGAGLIGATAGFGMYIAALQAAALQAPQTSLEAFMAALVGSGKKLVATRPTAMNLEWAVKRQLGAITAVGDEIKTKIETALDVAQTVADEDAEFCRRLGEHGKAIIKEISEAKGGEPVNVLTHCNAGWLAFVDYGSAHSAGLCRP